MFTEDGWIEDYPVEDPMTYYCVECGLCHGGECDWDEW